MEMIFMPINIGIHGIRPGMVENEPKFDKVWEKIKQEELQNNFKTAIEVPLSMANNIVELINIIRFVDKHGCETSASDVKQAYILAETAIRSSIFLIKSNLVFVNDQDFQTNISKKIDELETELKM
jgi:methenyltetrahydrofolate cyclohydrolase